MRLTINFLHYRRNFVKMLCYMLNRITDEHKRQVRLHFITQTLDTQPDQTDWEKYLADNLDGGIERIVQRFPFGFNYMEKIRWGLDNGGEYSMKLDEDILMNNHVIDFMLDNLNILDRGDVLFLSPALSIGIPTVEMFLHHHLTPEERDAMHHIWLNTTMLNRWGVDYSSLNRFTVGAQQWMRHEYYGAVGQINHPYKGVHPVRQSYRAQKYMFKLLLDKVERFKENLEYKIDIAKYPYFCNSVFAIRTDVWRRVIDDPSLYIDSFEEVPLNQYCDRNGLKQAFIENACCVHSMYNDCLVDETTKDENRHQAENDFYAEFERRVCV